MRFLGLAVAIVVALCAVGWLPTRRLAGAGGLPAMLAGCAISLVSAALAGWLLTSVDAETPEAPHAARNPGDGRAGWRSSSCWELAAALSGEFARKPLLFWLATAYVALLPLEVRLAIL